MVLVNEWTFIISFQNVNMQNRLHRTTFIWCIDPLNSCLTIETGFNKDLSWVKQRGETRCLGMRRTIKLNTFPKIRIKCCFCLSLLCDTLTQPTSNKWNTKQLNQRQKALHFSASTPLIFSFLPAWLTESWELPNLPLQLLHCASNAPLLLKPDLHSIRT